MRLGQNVSYEVQGARGKRWVTDSIHQIKSPAMERAQALHAANQFDAVRVIEDDGRSKEKIVFHKDCTPIERPITASSVDETPLCTEIDDFYGFEARLTIGRVLRQYLDHNGITALELVHDTWQFKLFANSDNLVNQAIHKIASLQSRAYDRDGRERVDFLYSMLSRLAERSRDAEDTGKYLEVLDKKGITAMLGKVEASVAPDQRRFHMGAAFAGFLGRERDWRSKILLVVGIADDAVEGEALAWIDEMVAEIMDGTAAVKEVLGPQPDLASALHTLVLLAAGRYRVARGRGSCIEKLNALMARLNLPMTRRVLLERVEEGLRGIRPLTRESEATDRSAYIDILRELVGIGGLMGGKGMSEAVVRRSRMVLSVTGSDLTGEQGIRSIMTYLPSVAAKIGFLLDIGATEFGRKYQVHVLKALLGAVQGISSLAELLPAGSSREDYVKAVGELRERLGEGVLPEGLGEQLSKRLDRVLAGRTVKAKAPSAAKVEKAAKAAQASTQSSSQQFLNRKEFAAGEFIFHEGDQGDEAYLIASGRVEISLKSGKRKGVLAIVERGEIIGEMALVDDQVRMASAKALEDTVLSVMPRENFKKRLDRVAEEDRMIHRLIETFVNRLRAQARND